MITEHEAKTKWCPLVRYLATFRGENGKLETAGCFNRGGADSGLETARCIASECMAWQWGHQEYEEGEPLPFGTNPADPGWEKNGEVWCAGGEYGTGHKRQKWSRAKPRAGCCTALGQSIGGLR